MKISMYQASAPRFANALRNLSAILDKAQAHADAKKLDPAVPGGLRLIADMFPLARQVQIACDTAKGAVARLAGVEIPRHEEREVILKVRGQDVKYHGLQYLLGHAWPNFYFHLTTAYNILRANGVELGKRDFIGQP
jgi:hypothetical protein